MDGVSIERVMRSLMGPEEMLVKLGFFTTSWLEENELILAVADSMVAMDSYLKEVVAGTSSAEKLAYALDAFDDTGDLVEALMCLLQDEDLGEDARATIKDAAAGLMSRHFLLQNALSSLLVKEGV